jgi:putative transposase
MLVRKAYRFKIYPEATQEELFRRTVGCCRLVYNLCLDQKKLERERSEPRKLSQFDQIKELTALKAEFDFLREVPHHPLVQTVMDLHKAFSNFFEHRPAFQPSARRGRTTASAIRIPSKSRSRTTGSSCRKRAGRRWSCTARSSAR